MHKNAILSVLPAERLANLAPRLVTQRLSPHQVLREAGDKLTDVYFLDSGLVSLLSGADGARCETTLVGREGLIGVCALVGETSAPSTAVVRAAGVAWRIAREDLLRAVEGDPELHRHLLRYVNVRLKGAAQAVIVASQCTIIQRVAGWLLMAHDRIDTDEMSMTHDHLAAILSVRRPGITVALHVLEGEYAVSSQRSRITIRSREILMRQAGSAYQMPSRAFGHTLTEQPDNTERGYQARPK